MQQRINKIREAILFGKNYIVFGTGYVAVAAAMEISHTSTKFPFLNEVLNDP